MAIINGTNGPETLPFTVDSDEIFGFGGNDVLNGGRGDLIEGGDGFDDLIHNISTDYQFDDFVGDTLSEGGGNAIIDVGVTVDGGDGFDRVTSNQAWRFNDGVNWADDDAFVLPLLPDDQPLILPGVEADKFADQPLILPGEEEALPLFSGLELHLAHFGDWMATLDPNGGGLIAEPAFRENGWI